MRAKRRRKRNSGAGPAALRVRVIGRRRQQGFVEVGGRQYRCAIGRSGIGSSKREGDGATPAGRWRLVLVLWRADRGRRPQTGLAARPIRREDGWCDAPDDRNYNRPVRHPYPASAERLWRGDHLYDVVVVLDHNRRPRVRGMGSAIFMHVARPDLGPTEGCIALAERDLRLILSTARRGSSVVVG